MIKVTAAIFVQNDKILIAQRKAGDKLEYKWEFPGGKINPGETPEECLARELKEEFLVESSIGDFFGESIYHYNHGAIQLLAYWVSFNEGELKPTVHEKVLWVSPCDLDKYEFCPADIPLVKKLMEELL